MVSQYNTEITIHPPAKQSAMASERNGSNPNEILRIIGYTILLSMFFEPMYISYASLSGNYYAEIVERIFQLGKVCISYFALIMSLPLMSWKRERFLVLMLLIIVVTTAINMQASDLIFEVARSFSFLGLIALLCLMNNKSIETTLNACCLLFIIITVCNIVSIGYVTANGSMVQYGERGSLIYFFGGKNSLFISGIPLVASLAVREALLCNKVSKSAVFASFVYFVFAICVDSTSSAICFLLTGLFLVLMQRFNFASPVFSLSFLVIFLAILFILTIILRIQEFFPDLFLRINRSADFSDRNILWQQAIELIKQNPIFGNGTNISYYSGMYSQVVFDHPHSTYLQLAASYGVITVVFLVSDIMLLWRSSKPSLASAIASIMLFVLLFHSLYDIINLYVYMLLRQYYIFCANIGISKSAQKCAGNINNSLMNRFSKESSI